METFRNNSITLWEKNPLPGSFWSLYNTVNGLFLYRHAEHRQLVMKYINVPIIL